MDGRTSRNYSLASVPSLDDDLMMHVRRVPGGQVSGWIFDQVQAGDTVTISEAFGDCFYVPGRSEQNLLLLGTGCGLAPLYGIARDALNSGHRGRIHLYHGSRDACGLYLVKELDAYAAAHPNFRYRPCISEGPSAEGYWAGTPLQAALDETPDLGGWRVYLCGNPQMVEAARMQTFLAGAGSSEIFADPFLPSGNTQTPGQQSAVIGRAVYGCRRTRRSRHCVPFEAPRLIARGAVARNAEGHHKVQSDAPETHAVAGPQLLAIVDEVEKRADHQRHLQRRSRNTGLQREPQHAGRPAHRGGCKWLTVHIFVRRHSIGP